MASHLMRADGAVARSLHTISHVSDDSPEWDERRFIQAVERGCKVPSTHLNADTYPLVSKSDGVVLPDVHPIYRDVARLMRHEGAHVLLSGRFGDSAMGNVTDDAWIVADALSWRTLPKFVALAHQESLA